MPLISVRCPGLASGVSLADVTTAVIRGAAADRRLAVTLSRSEGSRARIAIVDGWVSLNLGKIPRRHPLWGRQIEMG